MITNPGSKLINNINIEQEQKLNKRKVIPEYVSKDYYKDITDKQTRINQVTTDYFYLLDMALATYYANKDDIYVNVMTKDIYLPVLVFVKYISDNEVYIYEVPSDKLKTTFDTKYKNILDITSAMKFLNELANNYKSDKKTFNDLIFGKYVFSNVTYPNIIVQERKVVEIKEIIKQDACKQEACKQEAIKAASTDTTCVILPGMPNNTCLCPIGYVSKNNNCVVGVPDYTQAQSYNYKYEDFNNKCSVKDYIYDPMTTNQFRSDLSQTDPIFQQISICRSINCPSDFNTVGNSCTKQINNKNLTILKPIYLSIPISFDKSQQQSDNTYDYNTLPNDIRNKTVLTDYINLYKAAIDILVINKFEFYQVYQNRTTDVEFLNLVNFIPVLKFAKYTEDNKLYIEQLSQSDLQNEINNAYPNFMKDPKFKVQGIHIQIFIILASNLYNSNPTECNQAILGIS
jgi:hypothetical protein